jgi:large subunit ribosomal protein L13
MKTTYTKSVDADKKWHIVNLKGLTLGRVSTEIANILMGKTKPTYSTSQDMGDFVIAINSKNVKLTGNKLKDKLYRKHTGHMGGLREITAEKLLDKDPTQIIKHAVKGMLPKGVLGRAMFKKLKVYSGSEHPHSAQNPQELQL